jgi:YVTN family beta-propeller protein
VSLIKLSAVPGAVAVKPNGEYVYVASEVGNRVSVVRTSDNATVSSVAVDRGPTDLLFSPSGETAYVACPATSSIDLLRTSDLSPVGSVTHDSLGVAKPWLMTMLPGGQCLYTATKSYGSEAAIVRRSDNYLLRRLRLDNAGVPVPHPDGTRVYYPASSGIVVLGLRR